MRRMKNLVTAVALVVIVSGMGATAARGQGIFSSSDFSGAGAYDYRLSSALHPSSNTASSRAGNTGRSTRGATSGASRRVGRASSGTTTFRPVGGTIVPQQMAAQLAKSPQDRQELEQVFTKMLNFYEDLVRSNKVPVDHDVARATAFNIEANYTISTNSEGLTPTQHRAMRETIEAALSRDGKFQAMSAREKQRMYETMAIMGAYVLIGRDAATQKNDKTALAEFRQLAKENFEHLLGPIDKVSFTDNGIVFK